MKKLLTGLVILVVLLLAVVGILVGLVMGSRDKLPADPAIAKIVLAVKKARQPVAKKLQAYLATSKASGTKVQALHALRKKKKKSHHLVWPDATAIAKGSKALDKALQAFLAALDEKGCYPRVPVKVSGPSPSHGMRWIISVKLASLHALALTQGGEPDKAAALLLKLSAKLDTFERDCPGNLIDTMIWAATRSMVLEYLSYPFAHPKLSVATQKKVLTTLQKASVRTSNPMSDAMRLEYDFQLRTLTQQGKDGRTALGTPMLWPLWDRAETMAWHKRHAKIMVYRALQPFGPALWKPTKSGKALDKYVHAAKKSYLRYNYAGRLLLSLAAPVYTRFIARWHASRCEAAARHALFVRFLKKHKAALNLTDPLPTESNNPLTKKAFGKIAGKKACGVNSPTGKGSFKGSLILGMPPLWKAPQGDQKPTKTPTPR